MINICGIQVDGTLIPSVGTISETYWQGGALIVNATNTKSSSHFAVVQEGEIYAFGDDSLTIPQTFLDAPYIHFEPCSDYCLAAADMGLYVVKHYIDVGFRIYLTWTVEPTDTDWEGYVLKWDAGTGTVDTTLVELGKDEKFYTTDILTSGTYKFALCYSDTAGNVSAVVEEQIVSVTLIRPPSQPTVTSATVNGNALDIVYTSGTDGTGVAVFTNHHPLFVDKDYPAIFWLNNPITKFDTEGTVSIPQLCAGDWEIYVCSINKYGTLSYPAFERFLISDGEVYVKSDPVPKPPITLTGELDAGAIINLTCYCQPDDDATHVRFYEGSNLISSQARTATDVYTYEYSGVDTTEYTFYACTYNTSGESVYTEGVTITADGTAPTATSDMEGDVIC